MSKTDTLFEKNLLMDFDFACNRKGADYDEVVERYAKVIKDCSNSDAISILERLLAEHIELCGATYQKDERDDCILEKLIIAELNKLKEGE